METFNPSYQVIFIFLHQESVPLNDYIRLEHRLSLALAKNKILLEREKNWIQLKNQKDVELYRSRDMEVKANEMEVQLVGAQAEVRNNNLYHLDI